MGWTEDSAGTAHGETCVVLRLDGPLCGEDLTALCRRVETLIRLGRGNNNALVCDVTALDMMDLGLIDQLARLRLSARRAGGTVTFRHAGSALKALMALIGLDELLLEPDPGAASVERQRQTEKLEEAGVEEDIEVRHPPL
jgi:anti-anti-sigma regulatory factor